MLAPRSTILRPMCADLDFPISLQTYHSTSPGVLLEQVKDWLRKKVPTCLMHPNGFWVVLLSRSEMEEWRFHFWPLGEAKTTGTLTMIHTHDRVVESRVILGKVKNTLFREMDAESGGRPVYGVSYGGDRFVQGTPNILRRTGQLTAVTPTVEQVLKVGDCYRVEAHTYHEAVVERYVAAATVVRMHSPISGGAKVLGLPASPDQIAFQRPRGSSEELLQLIP